MLDKSIKKSGASTQNINFLPPIPVPPLPTQTFNDILTKNSITPDLGMFKDTPETQVTGFFGGSVDGEDGPSNKDLEIVAAEPEVKPRTKYRVLPKNSSTTNHFKSVGKLPPRELQTLGFDKPSLSKAIKRIGLDELLTM